MLSGGGGGLARNVVFGGVCFLSLFLKPLESKRYDAWGDARDDARGVAWGIVFQSRFLEGDATKHFSVKKGVCSERGGGNSVNQGFGKGFCRKGKSVKRFW